MRSGRNTRSLSLSGRCPCTDSTKNTLWTSSDTVPAVSGSRNVCFRSEARSIVGDNTVFLSKVGGGVRCRSTTGYPDRAIMARIMKRRTVLAGIAGTLPARTQAKGTSSRDKFAGVWKLISIEMTVDGKTLLPYGDTPIGRLTYDAAGRVTAQVMRTGRKSSVVDPGAVGRSTDNELRDIAEGYVGYFGTFTVAANTVTHHIEGCTLPAWTGTDQTRQFEFAGNRLILRFGSNKLVRERLPR